MKDPSSSDSADSSTAGARGASGPPVAPEGSAPRASGAPVAATREAVRSLVLAAGFHRVGVARAGLARRGPELRRWIEEGLAADMAYLGRSLERRLDPRLVLEGARSVIVAAIHYAQGIDATSAAAPRPPMGATIAAYARGTDYHRVLERRLQEACRHLEERHGGRHRYYVDTGPVLERGWCEEAGVGWIGKNACAIHPVDGSYFFIGVILTTLELAPDEPHAGHCGSCRLCLDACPTGALFEPWRLDSRRCLSYWTIEHRGLLPAPMAHAAGSLIFGCDICQDVCPFNQRPGRPPDAELAAREENLSPSLLELAALDADGLRRRFRQSAVKRARPQGILRNILVALGNDGSEPAIAALEQLGRRADVQADPVLAETCARSLRRARQSPAAPRGGASPGNASLGGALPDAASAGDAAGSA